MTKEKLPKESNSLKLFEGSEIRSVWNEEEGEWYFSVVDVVQALTDSPNPRDYWYRVKKRMDEEEKAKLSTICRQLKLESSDGKKYKTDASNTKGVLRIIQSIPSPKAEPFKQWLAKVGSERIDEEFDPELAVARAVESYRRKGYSEEWINRRMLSIKVRNGLTDEWHKRGVKKGNQFAMLTDIISKEWSGMTTREYKNYKGLKKESLRDNMTDSELILNMLAENTAKEISKSEKPATFAENQDVARRGGKVAGIARKAVEESTGKPVVTDKNYLPGTQKRIEE
ncbi:Bro-N domain-containing protein [Candidatus Saccharibacteria bacterium]|nr:Bro-N domain-containing protein [Candidatus Saccharibacteria bacterium]